MKRKNDIVSAAIVLVFFLISGGSYFTAFAAPPASGQAVQTADYYYNPAGKPNPFRPFVEKELVLKKKAEQATVSSIFPLQNAGIEQFNLVGIAGNVERRVAIVESMDGKTRSYPVTIGTVIGLNKGRVVEIKNDMIVIEEAIKGSARQKINRIIKKLHKEEEGTP